MSHELWRLSRRNGRLHLDENDLIDLADRFGTPLHVASAQTLRMRCQELQQAMKVYPGETRIHYSYKTNSVAGVLEVIHEQGIGAEVVGHYELWLAQRMGVLPDSIILNGPNKSETELVAAVNTGIGLIVVDGLDELERLIVIAQESETIANIALRICPDIVSKGMNTSSMTGSRRNQFGMDRVNELPEAIRKAQASPHLRLRGAMAHIGSGIHHLASFKCAVQHLIETQNQMFEAGASPDLLDIGGGLGTCFSREFTTLEMLAYLGLGRLPKLPKPAATDLAQRYSEVISEAVVAGCTKYGMELPTLVMEPGRALVSDCQLLLLSVGAMRHRPGVGKFAIVDGGAMTVSMMFLSEHHTVFLANREAPIEGRINVFGRLPSPMDVVYRNIPLPALKVGDRLAVMDAGAYFTATSTNFGGPRPPVVLLDGQEVRLVRRRETFADLASLELPLQSHTFEDE